jgi:hypothetical protein
MNAWATFLESQTGAEQQECQHADGGAEPHPTILPHRLVTLFLLHAVESHGTNRRPDWTYARVAAAARVDGGNFF